MEFFYSTELYFKKDIQMIFQIGLTQNTSLSNNITSYVVLKPKDLWPYDQRTYRPMAIWPKDLWMQFKSSSWYFYKTLSYFLTAHEKCSKKRPENNCNTWSNPDSHFYFMIHPLCLNCYLADFFVHKLFLLRKWFNLTPN